MNRVLISAFAIVATSNVAVAHPGEHALTVLNSLWHLATEADHLAMLALAAAVAIAVACKRINRAA